MSNEYNKFVIRVYGLFINSHNEILLSDEFQLNMKMTKFPGGGMQFGEGTRDCLRREIMEEMGQEIAITEHFYTTDYFQPAFFYDNYQLVSIYYLANFKNPLNFRVSSKPFDFPELKNGNMSFRWVSLAQLSEKEMTFPVDKKVVGLLKERFL
ncbi:MAG: NUDIX domain-containing protein [Bacteroidales bacterium]|jgi:ADP-ribose pyrophosphatase YjhB (NUDIX family)|nr:NUDIX domain-containing protein [Bacteroidales bacterium]